MMQKLTILSASLILIILFSLPTMAELNIEMVSVPGGCYQMGDTFGDGGADEKPVHEVCLDSFAMGKYEVTQGQWQVVMGSNPSYFKGADLPVERVSWDEVQAFIGKLNSQTGRNYRLPTEAEWEYAARSGGQKQRYAGDDNIDNLAWYEFNSGKRTHPVGQKQANGLGLYDMSGNVWEWCQDWLDPDYYKNSPRSNPKGPASDGHRVLRGGSWANSPKAARAAERFGGSLFSQYSFRGFRLVLPAGR